MGRSEGERKEREGGERGVMSEGGGRERKTEGGRKEKGEGELTIQNIITIYPTYLRS